jgi:hypothetical protein
MIPTLQKAGLKPKTISRGEVTNALKKGPVTCTITNQSGTHQLLIIGINPDGTYRAWDPARDAERSIPKGAVSPVYPPISIPRD